MQEPISDALQIAVVPRYWPPKSHAKKYGNDEWLCAIHCHEIMMICLGFTNQTLPKQLKSKTQKQEVSWKCIVVVVVVVVVAHHGVPVTTERKRKQS